MHRFIKENRAGFLVLLAGIAMTAAGCILGEPAIVLKKAVMICLECIGIG